MNKNLEDGLILYAIDLIKKEVSPSEYYKDDLIKEIKTHGIDFYGYLEENGEWKLIDELSHKKYELENLNEEMAKENKQLKDNWNELKKWLRIKDILANSKINPQSIKFKDLLKHMEYLEKER